MSPTTSRRLSRATDGRRAAPVRHVHLGAGNFFRAHQAWYTQHAGDAGEWGIAAFTGRSPAVAEDLAPSDGLYTLAIRAADGDRTEVISSLSAVHPGDDLEAWRGHLADPAVVLVTSTITEAGYRRGPEGGLDRDDPEVAADIEALAADPRADVRTAPGRLVAGLAARRAAGAGPITLVPCDNVPDNGEMVRAVVLDLADAVDEDLAAWIDENIAVVTTMVDRITPRTTDEDRAALASGGEVDGDAAGVVGGGEGGGVDDPALVVTEPFTEWVLAGEFAAGRPAWEDAGARFVDDITPFETRKLWLLNGSHSLMAYAATILGHATVADAIADPQVRGWVEAWWDLAGGHLDLQADEVNAYRAALVERYENPRIRHLLAQIASDGSQKLPIRIVPVLRAARAAGEPTTAASRVVAAWLLHLRGVGAPVTDPKADTLAPLVAGPLRQAASAVVAHLGFDGEDARALSQEVFALAEELNGRESAT
ncbi:mannitol dehydrogenase family protein [Agilicoccus flavus]|uniref:mannitol dehydrogenase family protein n=1 Tax=Agilicoccus flavus TaxID=2775968 RepID=UPI001CF621FB|nr:mannitol dehydrogenase family protein [Agilicoccus flavus]